MPKDARMALAAYRDDAFGMMGTLYDAREAYATGQISLEEFETAADRLLRAENEVGAPVRRQAGAQQAVMLENVQAALHSGHWGRRMSEYLSRP